MLNPVPALRAALLLLPWVLPGVALAQVDARTVVYVEAERTRGAGVVLSSDGLIITSTRTIGRAGSARVTVHPSLGGTHPVVDARVLARDDWFALLQADVQGLVPARLGGTAGLKLNDRVVTLSASGTQWEVEETALGAVAPLKARSVALQEPLLTAIPYQFFNAGGPVWSMDGRVLGLVQSSVSSFRGSRANRVEDVRDFLVRNKLAVPQRQLTLEGEPGLTAETEHIRSIPLPITFTHRPGDIVTFRLSRNGRVCGLYRPDTASWEPRTTRRVEGTGVLLLETVPATAEVEINGVRMGPSPLALDCMMPGQHDVVVQAPGYETSRQQITVRTGEMTRARVHIRRLEGTLTVRTRPVGGEAWLDGRLLGTTPVMAVKVPAGSHVLSVLFPGGARVRRAFVMEDGGSVDLGPVSLPAPGAVLSVEHDHVQDLFIDGWSAGDLRGHVVLAPGRHVIQARDDLGNVLTEEWDAPSGGVRVVRFNGGASRLLPVVHVAGGVALAAAVVLATGAVVAAAGAPLGLLAGYWLAGGVLDALHRRAWLPSLAVGAVVAIPLATVAVLLATVGTGVIPFERFFRQGTVVSPGPAPLPVPWSPTPGWELRPVAGAGATGDDAAEDSALPGLGEAP